MKERKAANGGSPFLESAGAGQVTRLKQKSLLALVKSYAARRMVASVLGLGNFSKCGDLMDRHTYNTAKGSLPSSAVLGVGVVGPPGANMPSPIYLSVLLNVQPSSTSS